MNFFPNLQINFHIHTSNPSDTTTTEDRTRTQPVSSTTRSEDVSPTEPTMTSLLSSVLRSLSTSPSINDVVNTTRSHDDMNLLFTILYPVTHAASDNEDDTITIDELTNGTTLFPITEEDIRDGKECYICQQNAKHNEIWRVIRLCGHCFHQQCIDKWICRNSTCPVCRSSIRNENTPVQE